MVVEGPGITLVVMVARHATGAAPAFDRGRAVGGDRRDEVVRVEPMIEEVVELRRGHQKVSREDEPDAQSLPEHGAASPASGNDVNLRLA
jgi:hypothetical protein